MKKKILAMAVVLICVSILASTTLAFFTDSGTAHNVITTGGIRLEIVEQQNVDGEIRPYPAEPIRIMPGSTVSKIVSLRSLAQSGWLRAKYTITVLDSQGKAMNVPAEELEKMIIIDTDTEKWTEKDGWFYYAEALSGGESTGSLFTQVQFSGPEMGNEYQNCSIIIDVVAQAVQQANNGDSALTAAGWPEE